MFDLGGHLRWVATTTCLGCLVALSGCPDPAVTDTAPPVTGRSRGAAGATGTAASPATAPDAPKLAAGEEQLAPVSGKRELEPTITSFAARMSNGMIDVLPAAQGTKPQIEWSVVESSTFGAAPASSLHLILGRDAAGNPLLRDECAVALDKAPRLHLILLLPPTLPLDLNVQSGVLSIDSHATVKVDMQEGQLKLAGGFSGSTIKLTSGNVTGSQLLTQGEHDWQLEHAPTMLTISKGSSVKYDVTTDWGGVELWGLAGEAKKVKIGARGAGQVGAGQAQLKIHAKVGSFKLLAEGQQGTKPSSDTEASKLTK